MALCPVCMRDPGGHTSREARECRQAAGGALVLVPQEVRDGWNEFKRAKRAGVKPTAEAVKAKKAYARAHYDQQPAEKKLEAAERNAVNRRKRKNMARDAMADALERLIAAAHERDAVELAAGIREGAEALHAYRVLQAREHGVRP